MPELKITPSILGIDYGRMNEHLSELAPFSDMFHVDVMDGNFVDNLTIGAPVVERIKTDVPLDCHLMIKNPHRYVEEFAKAGAASITIHAEASLHLSDDIQKIKDAGCKACVALNPDTPVDKISKVLPICFTPRSSPKPMKKATIKSGCYMVTSTNRLSSFVKIFTLKNIGKCQS